MMGTAVRRFGTHRKPPSLAADLVECWRAFAKTLFDPYRPELHYMRGRGPKWHAKQAAASRSADGIAAPALLPVRVHR
jgi:hypothetical protein